MKSATWWRIVVGKCYMEQLQDIIGRQKVKTEYINRFWGVLLHKKTED